jgi:uncharacterized protein YndB with AHSA1/START domain
MSNNDLVYTTYIKTTPEKLWNAITNPEFTRQYWAGNANVSDWKKGSDWQHVDMDNPGKIHHIGKVLECSPPSRLVLSWFTPGKEEDTSRVTFEITPVEDLVRLDVVHNEFIPDSQMAKNVSKGWPGVIASMKSYLETGKGIDLATIFKGGCSSQAA